jgi:chemotaxis protein MotB
MRTAKLCGLIMAVACMVWVSGCGSELQDLRLKNETQQRRIAGLESELDVARMELEKLRLQLGTIGEEGNIELETLLSRIAALEEDIAQKKRLMASMQERLLNGIGQLPMELTNLLSDLADKYDMITYDPNLGVLKFESDLTFEPGSDQVTTTAANGVKSLCTILNSSEAAKFDVIIAGHTDDIPILKPATKAKHPTNWHLSAHRSISVLNIMTANSISTKRLSVRGFGEFRPLEPNKPGNKGNAKNRRVEIFIVPQGM